MARRHPNPETEVSHHRIREAAKTIHVLWNAAIAGPRHRLSSHWVVIHGSFDGQVAGVDSQCWCSLLCNDARNAFHTRQKGSTVDECSMSKLLLLLVLGRANMLPPVGGGCMPIGCLMLHQSSATAELP